MTEQETIVIAGAGQAGARAAAGLRMNGFSGRVVLVGSERYPPYERPPLSKECLTRNAELKLVNRSAFYAEQNIELRTGITVESIDRSRHEVSLSDDERLRYSQLLLATGARVRTLNVAGHSLGNILYLRTANDAQALRRQLVAGAHLVVIGGGFIGLEVAASARALGCQVTVVEAADRLMARAVPGTVSEIFLALHRSHGVAVELNTKTAGFDGQEMVEQVVLEDGRCLRADIVVVGVGVIPNTGLAEAAGLQVSNGIVVDEYCRTSDPDIFAAGDVTSQFHPMAGHYVRLESWQNAQDQASVAAQIISGRPPPQAEVPWVWSDQFDTNLQIAGFPTATVDCVVRGDRSKGAFTVFTLRDDRITGAVSVNRGEDMILARRLMARGSPVCATSIADETLRLRAMLA